MIEQRETEKIGGCRARAAELLAKMTLKEKVGQTVMIVPDDNAEECIRRGGAGSVITGGRQSERLLKLQKIAVEKTRLGIPLLINADVIHGFETGFPIPLASSCSFDLEKIEGSARIAAREATCVGYAYNNSPMVDVARDPRWGRIAEGAGEDPFLGGEIAKAYVRGYQGTDVSRPDSMIAALKHYLGYGAAEGGKDYAGAELSDVTVKNVYFPPFREGIRAGAGSIMCAFHVLNGVPMTGNRKYMRDLLRAEAGFDGMLISDYNSIREMIAHGVCADAREATKLAVEAGVDIDLCSNCYSEHLESLVTAGEIPESLIDECVLRILVQKFAAGLFDEPYSRFRPEDEAKICCPEFLDAAEELAAESAVLLKNNGVLPLKKGAKVALIGPFARSEDLFGCWMNTPHRPETLEQGLRAEGFDVTAEEGCGVAGPIRGGKKRAVELARASDVVLVALGEGSQEHGEGHSKCYPVLPACQADLLDEVRRAGTPVVLLLSTGRPLVLTEAEPKCDAILVLWALGSRSARATASLLSGRRNPSGKLTANFPRSAGQIPAHYNRLPSGRPDETYEVLWVRYLDETKRPLYPFGSGQGYSRIEYSERRLSRTVMTRGGSLTASVRVKNAGTFDATEIVMMYLRDPAARISRPLKELKGFRRIGLKAGEEREVSFEITEDLLGYYDAEGTIGTDPGEFRVWLDPDCEGEEFLSFRLEDAF